MGVLELFVHIFTPHHTNNHRAKALHVDSLLFYVLLFAVFNLGIKFFHKTMPDVLGYATDIHVEKLLEATNAKRAQSGLAPLVINPRLSEAAASKARDMFAHDYWAHNSPSGRTPWDFINGSGYKYVVAGENLAKNFSDSTGVVDAWMASPTHRDNVLKPSYRDVGFAVVNGVLGGEETTLVVQMFGATTKEIAAVPPVERAPIILKEAMASEEVQEIATAPVKAVATAFTGVNKQPIINISTLSHNMIFVFIAILLGVLAIDAWIVSRRKIVRVAGHNLGHFLFFTALLVLVSSTARGSLL